MLRITLSAAILLFSATSAQHSPRSSALRSPATREVPTFENLHVAIQDACGWDNCHLYAFHEALDGPVIAGIPDDTYGRPDPNAAKVKLATFFSENGLV